MTLKWLERNRIWLPCGRNWWEMFILTNQRHFLITCTWEALNVNANRRAVFEQDKEMFESRISTEATEQWPGWEKPHANTVAWSYDMEGHARKCVERYCELAIKKMEQLYKVSSPCLDDHHVKKEELESVGELSEVCSQIVLTCLYLTRIGTPDILWSVSKLARGSITKWTQAYDRRLARLISHIHNTNDYCQYCHEDNTAQHGRLGSFQDTDFRLWPRKLKINLGMDFVYIWKSNICSISWMCKKQTSVSHSSTGSEIISLDAGLRMDGSVAVDFVGYGWLKFYVLRTTPKHQLILHLETICAPREQKWNQKTAGMMSSVVTLWFYVPTNAYLSQCEFQLYIFKDNEAVIEMKTRRQKSNNETRVKNRQSSNWLVVWQNHRTWTQESKSNTLTQRTNLQTCWQKEASHVMNWIIFFICGTPWISRCAPAAIHFFLEERSRRNFQGKFDNNEAKIHELGDGETEFYYIGAVQHVEYE